MKLTSISLFLALILTVQADVSWYVGDSRNITCTGHDDGHIDCVSGHTSGAPEVTFYISPSPIRDLSVSLSLFLGP